MQDKDHIIANSLFQGLPGELKMELLKLGERQDFFEREHLFPRGDKGALGCKGRRAWIGESAAVQFASWDCARRIKAAGQLLGAVLDAAARIAASTARVVSE